MQRLPDRYREQARSHSDLVSSQILRTAAEPVGASLLAMTECQATSMLNVPASSRASPLPQWFGWFADFAYSRWTCGSEPARDDGVSGDIDVECTGLFASKPAPTVDLGGSQILRTATEPVGASLLAMTTRQPAM